MAYEIPGFVIGTEVASADLSTHQFKAVVFTSTGWALAGVGAQDVGFLQDKPTTDEVAQVLVNGVSKAVAGAAVAKGARLRTDATGRLVTAVATEEAVARALTAAGAANEILSVDARYTGVVP